MKIALVHDWFKANGGAEKVAGSIAALYAENDVTIYTLFNKFSKSDSDAILQHFPVKTSLMQHIPGIAAIYRYFLPVMPWLIEQFYLKQYDVVISTSHAVAKGIRVKEGVLNICYCHSPMRYVWDMYDDYVAQHGVSKIPMYRWLLQAIRKWDYQSSARVHFFIANSHHIKARIQKSYGRDATVIYPPVRTHLFQRYDGPRKHYFLCLGRLVPYKKMDLIARAFTQMPDKELVLIGEGYGSKDFVSVVEHSPNITWLGYQPDDVLIEYIQKAKACIFAAKEDFGISCVEVQACGTPVLALNYGGYKETVLAGISGYFFEKQMEQSIIDAVQLMDHQPLTDTLAIAANAERFSEQRFKDEIRAFVTACQSEFYKK